jgi:superfamily II DNA/RNA helicase
MAEEESEHDEDETFHSSRFSLSPQLLANLARQQLTTPTPVQRTVIPKIRDEAGADLCVNAPTGSGKTFAYALPIIEVVVAPLVQADDQVLSQRRFTGLGCVVIAPTRELVQQVREVFETCVRRLHLKVQYTEHECH